MQDEPCCLAEMVCNEAHCASSSAVVWILCLMTMGVTPRYRRVHHAVFDVSPIMSSIWCVVTNSAQGFIWFDMCVQAPVC